VSMASQTGPHGDLAEIRERLDELDRRLVELLSERGHIIGQVIEFKRVHGMSVVDREREGAMFTRIEGLASGYGLDPRIARRVLRAVIDAFTLVEAEQLGDN
jgi:chorismate mutase